MIRNYLLTTIRTFFRQATYGSINLLGLIVSFVSFFFILIYILDELSYDKFHGDGARIFRVNYDATLNGQEFKSTLTGLPLAHALMDEVPLVEQVVRVNKWNTMPVRYEDTWFTEKHFLLADSSFFQFFDFKLVYGNPASALRGPNKVVISESAAKRFFGYKGAGDLTPIGKTFAMGSRGEIMAEVTGIAQDPPHNSHLQFDFVLSLSTQLALYPKNWIYTSVNTYFKLKSGADVQQMNRFYDQLIKKYCLRELSDFSASSGAGNDNNRLRFSSISIQDIHLRSNRVDELEANGNIQYVYILSAIAFFIILLACINFMNLSIARATTRAKEIAVRKTVGALKSGLISQFMMESYLYIVLAVVCAGLIVYIASPLYILLSGKQIQFSHLLDPFIVLILIMIILLLGILAGSYPSFYLTSFQPGEIAKSKQRGGPKGGNIRNALVVFQFAISVGLIIATLMVNRQLEFIQAHQPGFNKENTIDLLHTWNLGQNAQAFKNELLSHPGIINASFANRLPPAIDWAATLRDLEKGESSVFTLYQMDYDHLETMGYQMIRGRFFSREFPTDTTKIIVNEKAARLLGVANLEDKSYLLSVFNTSDKVVKIIGVMKDFNFESLRSEIRPLVIMLSPEPNYEMAIKLAAGQVAERIKYIESIWKKFAPQSPFDYTFIDQNFAAQFQAEEQINVVFLVFTFLAIFIACLGLFGLASFSIEQRLKEIAIRKIMGASPIVLLVLLSKDFLKLIMIAFILSVPTTWLLLDQFWLRNFAYRAEFDFAIILIPGVLVLLAAIGTIVPECIRATVANPVSSIKNV
jgi:putative ABC transport system permease protein